MNPVQVSEKFSINVPVQALWRFLYDTDRLNRSLGLPTVSYVPDPDPKKKGHYAAVAKLGPLPLRYEEFPFEWVENRYYRVMRRFVSGPFRQMIVGVRMAAEGKDRSVLELFADVVPRNGLFAMLAPALIRKAAISSVIKQVRGFEDGYMKTGSVAVELRPPAVLSSVLSARLSALSATTSRADLVPKLDAFIRNGSDGAVAHIRPFEQADAWAAPRMDVLQFFLHATKAGILDLAWEVVCPHCKASTTSAANLSGLTADSACATCEEAFRADLSESIEAIFSVNPAIRVARKGNFCIGGPANMPRIIGQFRLEPSETRTETVAVDPGLLVTRCYQADGLIRLRADADESNVAVRVTCGEKGVAVAGDRVRANAEIRLELRNDLSREALVVLEKDNWRDTAATAAVVATNQEFRELFPEQAVAPGQEIRVGRLAVLFTDLQGSTALYSQIGDVRAFDFVHGHFAYLIAHISRNNGGLIKTIGDAVMAAFPSGREALQAALDMQAGWDDFMKSQKLSGYVGLRVGVHEGSAVAFNNRGLLDYFGTTVNMAARVQGQSSEREVVLSAEMAADPDVIGTIAGWRYPTQVFDAELKGIPGLQRLTRVLFPAS